MEHVRYAARPAARRRYQEKESMHPFVAKFLKQLVVSALIWCVVAGLCASQKDWAQKTRSYIGSALHSNVEYTDVLKRAEEIWHALKN